MAVLCPLSPGRLRWRKRSLPRSSHTSSAARSTLARRFGSLDQQRHDQHRRQAGAHARGSGRERAVDVVRTVKYPAASKGARASKIRAGGTARAERNRGATSFNHPNTPSADRVAGPTDRDRRKSPPRVQHERRRFGSPPVSRSTGRPLLVPAHGPGAKPSSVPGRAWYWPVRVGPIRWLYSSITRVSSRRSSWPSRFVSAE